VKQEPNHSENTSGMSRRTFLQGLGAGAAATGLLTVVVPPQTVEAKKALGKTIGPQASQVTLKINGTEHKTAIEPRHTLLDVMRQKLDITGPKPICERGSCGGCTVMVDKQPVYSCMMLAIDAVGKEITTVEGLSKDGELDPVQEAFLQHDAQMCGFCTPGFVVSVRALLDRNPNPTLDDVKKAVSGNTCRCGTYPRVFDAALTAAKLQRGGA
jgi:xanthine dehydrogenase YagT iron-sulfur-binding subunit